MYPKIKVKKEDNKPKSRTIEEKLRAHPLKYTLKYALLFILLIPTTNSICWDGCDYVYGWSWSTLLQSDMAFPSVLSSIFINLGILAIVFYLVVVLTLFLKVSTSARKIVWAFVLIATAFSHYFFFNYFTDEGREISAYDKYVASVQKELKQLKTKEDVISYIESQENYVDVVCPNKMYFEEPSDYIFDTNVWEAEKWHNGIRSEYESLKYGPTTYGDGYEYYCLMIQKVENYNYECLIYQSNDGPYSGLIHKFCFAGNNNANYQGIINPRTL